MEYETVCQLTTNRLGTEPYAGWCEGTGFAALLLDRAEKSVAPKGASERFESPDKGDLHSFS